MRILTELTDKELITLALINTQFEEQLGPKVSAHLNVALTWLVFDVIHDSCREHDFALEGLTFSGSELGDWNMRIVIESCPQTNIELYRFDTLKRDGQRIQLLALEGLKSIEIDRIRAYCIGLLSQHLIETRQSVSEFQIQSQDGRLAKISINKQTSQSKRLLRKILFKDYLRRASTVRL